MKKIVVILVLFALAAAGYLYFFRRDFHRRPHPVAPAVAQVGDSYLTTDDLRNRIPAEYADLVTYEQNVDYVKRWIDGEILYQTALAQGLDRDPAVRTRLDKMRRDLLMAEMIGRLLAQSPDVTEADIEKFYQENPGKFLRRETEVKYIHLCVRTQTEAWKVRDRVTPDNFTALAREVSLEPVEDSASAPYVNRSQVMPELAAVIFDIKIGGTTPPIRTPTGVYIVKILDKQPAGTVKPLKTVRDEIVTQISTRTQKVRLDETIASLRARMKVQYDLRLIPGKPESRPPENGAAPEAAPAAPARPAPAAARPAPAVSARPAPPNPPPPQAPAPSVQDTPVQ